MRKKTAQTTYIPAQAVSENLCECNGVLMYEKKLKRSPQKIHTTENATVNIENFRLTD